MKEKTEPFRLDTGEIIEEPTYFQERYVRKNGSIGIRTIDTYKSQTDQSFKDQCDVNNIVKRYEQTGQMPHITRAVGTYMDSTQFGDYAESLQRVLNANDAFMMLPATIRERFANDPAKLIEFMQNPNNSEEGVKLGLLVETKNANANAEKQNATNANTQTANANANTKTTTAENKTTST